jgi:phospholipid/cholesterol/gamma-HCH transport system substrate-binding protein/paraquat-inducible protein B
VKPNYFKVGVFLVLATALIVAAVVILGAGTFAPKGEYFETYFDQSVGGLSPGSPVELQGVKVGQVKNIGFVSEVYDIPPNLAARLGEQRLVRVVFAVDPRFIRELGAGEQQARRRREILSGLRLRLESNLLTGQSYLQGTYVDPNRFPIPQWPWEPEFPFVPSVPGEFATLKESLNRILTELDRLDIQKLFNHVDDLILTTSRAVADANVPGLGQQAQALLADLRVTNTRLQGLLARPDGDKEKEMVNLAMILDQLSATLRRVDLLITTQAPRLEGILENFRKVSADLTELSANLKRTPSDLLFSAPPRKSEVMK